jgi:hypothetical protein
MIFTVWTTTVGGRLHAVASAASVAGMPRLVGFLMHGMSLILRLSLPLFFCIFATSGSLAALSGCFRYQHLTVELDSLSYDHFRVAGEEWHDFGFERTHFSQDQPIRLQLLDGTERIRFDAGFQFGHSFPVFLQGIRLGSNRDVRELWQREPCLTRIWPTLPLALRILTASPSFLTLYLSGKPRFDQWSMAGKDYCGNLGGGRVRARFAGNLDYPAQILIHGACSILRDESDFPTAQSTVSVLDSDVYGNPPCPIVLMPMEVQPCAIQPEGVRQTVRFRTALPETPAFAGRMKANPGGN